MKILVAAYACDPLRGSEPGVGWNIASEVARRHDVWIVTRRKNRDRIEAAIAADPELRVRAVYHDVTWLQPFKGMPGGVYVYHYVWHMTLRRKLAALHRDIGFDVVHHLTLGSFRFPTSLHALGPPLVMGPLGGGEEAPVAFWRGFGWKGAVFEAVRSLSNRLAGLDPLVRRSGRKAVKILATSEDTRRRLQAILGEGAAIEVMPSIGITPAPSGEANRPQTDMVRLLFVGRHVPWKGCHLAIRAVAELHREGVACTFTVLGKGPFLPRLRGLAAALGVAESVTFVEEVGSFDEVRRLYQTHDIFLFPSLHEAGGMALIEAMVEGMVPVCLDIGGPAVSVRDGAGFTASGRSPDEAVAGLVKAVAMLVERPDVFSRTSAAARRRVDDEYTWPQKAAALDDIYSRAVDTVRRQP